MSAPPETRPEVLFLAHRIPYPPNKGDKIRSWRLLERLSSRFRVHLACFVDDDRDFAHTDFLKTKCASAAFVRLDRGGARLRSAGALLSGEPLTFGYFRHPEMVAAAKRLRARPLAAEVVFSSSMAPYIAAPVAGRKRIVDFCDADAEKWRQYAQAAPPLLAQLYKREARLLARAETAVANWSDLSFAVSPQEAAVFNNRPGARREVDWWANGVDAAYFNPALTFPPPAPRIDAVFTGVMSYRANAEAATAFARDVWPLVRRSAPEAVFAIVGADPTAPVRALDGASGVVVTGRVDDVRPWLAHAKVAVAPMRVARGVQNKVLEAMAMGKAIVASPDAVVGVSVGEDALCVAEDAASAARSIVRLLNDAEQRRRLGASARAAALSRCGWDAGLERFEAGLRALGLYSSSSRSSCEAASANN